MDADDQTEKATSLQHAKTQAIAAGIPGLIQAWGLAIWRPRKAIALIIATDPNRFLVANILMASAINWIAKRQSTPLSQDEIALALLGPIATFVFVLAAAKFMHWVGRWLDGKAGFDALKAALIWSIPAASMALLPDILSSFFSRALPSVVIHLLGLLALLFTAWSLIVPVLMVSEVQRFSILKAIANLLLAGLLLLLVMLAIVRVVISFTS